MTEMHMLLAMGLRTMSSSIHVFAYTVAVKAIYAIVCASRL